MRKQIKIKRRIISIVLLILIAIIAIVGNTYSKYISKVEGKGVIQVAKWAFLVNGQTASMTNINLAQNYENSTIIPNRIAPGTEGFFDIVIDTTGSEVGIEYNVKFSEEKNKPENMKFQYENKVVSSIFDLEEELKGIIDANAEEKIKTFRIKWFWDYETKEENQIKDIQDTKDGINLGEYSFNVTVTGTQLDPKLI